MRMKKLLCGLLAYVVLAGCLGTNALAVDVGNETTRTPLTSVDSSDISVFAVHATGTFHMDVPSNKILSSDISFSLEAKETVTINASYSPSWANMDFGLIAPDGFFYSMNVTGGSINKTIQVSERGSYTLAVKNNSSETVNVSGYVYY